MERNRQHSPHTTAACSAVLLEDIKWRWLAAVVPYYYNGNRTACRLYYTDGKSETVYHQVPMVLDYWMRYHNTTLETVQERARELAREESQRKLPLVVNSELCLLPLRCRKPQHRNNGTLGYVALKALYQVIEVDAYGTILFFHENHKGIPVLQRKASVDQQIQRGKKSLARYVEQLEDQKLAEEKLLQEKRAKSQKAGSRGTCTISLISDEW